MLSLKPGKDSLTFVVSGKPIAKERPRISIKRGKSVHTYTPRKTKGYEAAVRGQAHLKMMDDKRNRFIGPVRVTIDAVFSNGVAGDLDNVCKSICDGMNGVVYDDDRQIVELHATKKRGPQSYCAAALYKNAAVGK